MKWREIKMTLVIGYGNELRGDDAVGPRVVAAVNAWNLDGVIAQVVPQLTPELAEPISHAPLAVCVDAAAAPSAEEVQITRLDPSASSDLNTHLGDPRALLALSRALYGRCPTAWLITIPTLGFDFGAPLSARADRGVRTALAAIKELSRRRRAHTRPYHRGGAAWKSWKYLSRNSFSEERLVRQRSTV